jgi:hypothetical protein
MSSRSPDESKRTKTHGHMRAGIAVLAILALASLAESQTLGTSPPATDAPQRPAADRHILTHEQFLKMIWLNQQIGITQQIIGPAATALHLSRNRDVLVRGINYALKNGHEIDFAQSGPGADGFVFTETNPAGNFMYRVDSSLNPIAAVRIIGATSMSPIVVVPLSLGEPEARDNLDATLSAWATLIDGLAAGQDPGGGRP